jgi:hypothetical protein
MKVEKLMCAECGQISWPVLYGPGFSPCLTDNMQTKVEFQFGDKKFFRSL